MGEMGVLIGLAVLVFFAIRGVNVLVAALLGAVVVAATNQQSIAQALSTDFTASMMGFAGKYMLVFLMGAVFGRIMGESKAAAAVALALSGRMGPERVMYILTLACALLTYGGVNVFIVVFTIYPLGLSLMQQANLPKRLLVGPITLGSGTFTMTALPGSPSLQNIIAAKGLGTPLTAGPWIGITAAAMMFGLGIWYLERQRKAAQKRGEVFRPGLTDVVPERSPDPSQMPHPILAMIPILFVLLFIMIPLWLIAICYGPEDQLPAVLAFSKGQPELWICIAMVIGTLLGSGLFWNHLPPIWSCISRGAENAILPLINTGAVIGFGGVVKSTAAFKWFAGLMLQSDLPPLLSATLAINLIAGIVGSASGSLGIFMETLAKSYLDLGIDAGTLHRIVTIGSGGLDSLPHSGAVISFLTVLGLTHREAYKDIGVVSVVIPLVVLAILLSGLALMGIR